MTSRQTHRTHDRAAPHRPEARVIAFPLALNRKLVSRLVDRFLALPFTEDRANKWRRKELGQLERKRLAQGIAPEIIEQELWQVERAVTVRLKAMFPNDGGAA